MNKPVAFDYDKQAWIEGDQAAALRVEQIGEELGILRSDRGQEYLIYTGAKVSLATAIAALEKELAGLQAPAQVPIEIWRTLPAAMRLQGFVKLGTTGDRSMLREIARDYATQGIKIFFTRGALDQVHYWRKA